jgi:hypothetical protein
VRNMAAEFCLQFIFFKLVRLFYMPEIYEMGPTITLKKSGFEPANLGSSGKHATTRQPTATTVHYNNTNSRHQDSQSFRYVHPQTNFLDTHAVSTIAALVKKNCQRLQRFMR